MNSSAYIFVVTAENFPRVVLENSRRVPVLVDFWADWCAPCKMLMPVLAKLANDYQGKFLLAKIDSDDQRELAARYGVRSLPTVKVFRNGEVIDEFRGALPEGPIRDLLERHVERESDKIAQEARTALEQGDGEQAITLLQAAMGDDPGNYRVRMDLVNILMDTGRFVEAGKVITSLPADKRVTPEVRGILSRIQFATVTEEAPDEEALIRDIEVAPENCEARYQLGARYILAGNYAAALEQLLEIMRRDRTFQADAGRKGMIAVFEMLENKGPLVSRYRRLMSSDLY